MPPPMHALPSYQPPPPVLTEQTRVGKEPTHFKPYKHTYNGAQGKLQPGAIAGPILSSGLSPAGAPGRSIVPGNGAGFREQDVYSQAYTTDNPRPESGLGK